MRRRALSAIPLAIALAILAPGASARADAPAEIAVEAVPALGASGQITWGWNEVVVRIQNNGSKPARGSVIASASEFGGRDGHTFRATAPYSVGAGSSVHVRVPVDIGPYGDFNVDVFPEGREEGEPLSHTRLNIVQPNGVTLVDVSETSRLRGVIQDAPVGSLFSASGSAATGRGGSAPPLLSVVSPRFDPATGDPLLPDRAALWASADAVLLRSDLLSRLTGAELDAIAGFVLAGGTLAIAVVRPEDTRHPTLLAFAGGAITRRAVSSEALHELVPPASKGLGGSTAKVIPFAKNPLPDVSETLAGYYGGNLHGSQFGTTATYGLGEVHFLAFDPTRKPAVDDPWIHARMIELTRRAFDRRSTQIFRPGDDQANPEYRRVREELDPNQSSRWAIGVAALLLCLYAVLAGPLNFALASKKGQPLRALRHLPIYAAVAFALIVGIGFLAKGITGRARHLTLLEAGGGMTKGSARRFRGFFASRAKDLTVRTTDGSSVVTTAVVAESAEHVDHLLVDRDGARLVDVAALPWQTVVVREDGFASLGDGITLARDGDEGVTVVNRSGRDLRGAILRMPDGSAVYWPKIKDGERVASSAGVAVSSTPPGAYWVKEINSTVRAGALDIHRLKADYLRPILEGDAPGLAEAWTALEEAAGNPVDWFPAGSPTLIAQIDGGEGRASDSGLRVESDRLLVRVVGFGGKP